MAERMISTGTVDLCTEAFGDPSDIPLLLIMGATSSMLHWQPEFIQKLVDGGRYVIRYDNRDTGKSTCFDFETQPYTVADLAEDAVGVLDAYGIESVHAAGTSLGGMVVQHLALNHRARVRSIIPMSTSPDPAAALTALGEEPGATQLSPPTDEWIEAIGRFSQQDYEDREAVINTKVKMMGMLHGSYPYPEATFRAICEAEYDRAIDYAKSGNHGIAFVATPSWIDRLPSLDIPTLVIHGDKDIVMPDDHGRELARVIPGAELMMLEGVGHTVPEEEWDRVVHAMLNHTAF